MNNLLNEAHSPQKGRFISFEGTEGVGKTTAIDGLIRRLEAEGIDCIRTREPGGSSFAEKIRDMLLDINTDVNDDTELLMMFASRADHLSKVIIPALESGKWVVCDRFYDSSVAYQGFGRTGGDRSTLDKINMLIEKFVSKDPDLTLWLDLPLLIGMERAGKRGAADRFESEANDFFKDVYAGFKYQAENNLDRIKRIDASGSVEDVGGRIWAAVQKFK